MMKEAVSRALGYPYQRPPFSFIYDIKSGDFSELKGQVDVRGLKPVLALGSNAAPAQLRRKFPADRHAGQIICIKATVPDFDVVYAPLFSGYGSVPATLAHSPGADVQCCFNFMTEQQLASMHATEGAYDYCRIPLSRPLQIDPAVTLDPPMPTDHLHCYLAQKGVFVAPASLCPHSPSDYECPAMTPIALSEIPCEGRRFPALSQCELQQLVAASLCVPDGAAVAEGDAVLAAGAAGSPRFGLRWPSSFSPVVVSEHFDCECSHFVHTTVSCAETRAARVAALCESRCEFPVEVGAQIVSPLASVHVDPLKTPAPSSEAK